MDKIILLRGLPGAGQDKIVSKLMLENPGQFVRVSKDDIHRMLGNGKDFWNSDAVVTETEVDLILDNITNGFDVIVDDFNLDPKNIDRIQDGLKVIESFYKDSGGTPIKINVEVMDLTDVPLRTCIENDLLSERPFGKEIIMKLWQEWLMPKPYKKDKKLDDCIICDIDGTISNRVDRGIHQYSLVGTDKPVDEIVDLLGRYGEAHIIFITGREEGCRKETEQWLKDHRIFHNGLYMREKGDGRKDYEIKTELWAKHIKGKFNVKFVLEDRDQCVMAWDSLGLKCLRVNPGYF